MLKIDSCKPYNKVSKSESDVKTKNPSEIAEQSDMRSEAQVWQYLAFQGRANSPLTHKHSETSKATEKESVENAENGEPKRLTKDLTPIQSEEEYLEVLERVKKAKNEKGEPLWLWEEDLKNYPNITLTEQGLLPYCGSKDIHGLMNMYLSGRVDPTPELRDVVRVFDYSLAQLDKEVGVYDGIVFRQGFMGEKTEQYLSASKDPLCAARFDHGWFDPYDVIYRTYSVIKTKNGHDISKFQEKSKTGYANREREVVLPREAQYREVPIEECSEELLKAREAFASKLFRDAHKVFDDGKTKIKGYTKEDLLNLVKVYEEI